MNSLPTFASIRGKLSNMWVTHPLLVTKATHLDDRGRITIDRGLRPHLGRRVVQVLTPHGVLLRPVQDVLPAEGRLPSALGASGEKAAAEEAGR